MNKRMSTQASIEIPELATLDALAQLTPALVRAIGADFDLASLSGRLCPVLLDNGRVAIFALDLYVCGDQIDEVERLVRLKGYTLATPARYIVAQSLLLSVARRQITAETLRGAFGVAPANQSSALANLFFEFVQWGVRAGASDVHINVDRRGGASSLRFTIDGAYVEPDRFQGLSANTLLEVLAVAWMDVRGGNGAVFDPQLEQQGRISLDVDDQRIALRWASLATDAGPSVCLRILRSETPVKNTLSSLGYLPKQVLALENARERDGGAIVLAGVVGSGKSTTIATLMRGISPLRKVITLEDPVEYNIANALQNTVGGALDNSTDAAFDAKLKTIKRSAMNDLLIGEIRDTETGRAFMDLAASGVSVYCTTHTASAVMIPERLGSDSIGVSRDLLATPGVLKLLVYQVLLPRLCQSCSLPLESLLVSSVDASLSAGASVTGKQTLSRLQHDFDVNLDSCRVRNPVGCAVCRRPGLTDLQGYAGRTVAAEIIEPEHDVHFLDMVRRRDNLGLRRHMDAARAGMAIRDGGIGSQALDSALHKVSLGEVDPRILGRWFNVTTQPLCADDEGFNVP